MATCPTIPPMRFRPLSRLLRCVVRPQQRGEERRAAENSMPSVLKAKSKAPICSGIYRFGKRINDARSIETATMRKSSSVRARWNGASNRRRRSWRKSSRSFSRISFSRKCPAVQLVTYATCPRQHVNYTTDCITSRAPPLLLSGFATLGVEGAPDEWGTDERCRHASHSWREERG